MDSVTDRSRSAACPTPCGRLLQAERIWQRQPGINDRHQKLVARWGEALDEARARIAVLEERQLAIERRQEADSLQAAGILEAFNSIREAIQQITAEIRDTREANETRHQELLGAVVSNTSIATAAVARSEEAERNAKKAEEQAAELHIYAATNAKALHDDTARLHRIILTMWAFGVACAAAVAGVLWVLAKMLWAHPLFQSILHELLSKL